MTRAAVQGFQRERLRQILAVRKLTQAAAAEVAGVSATTVSKWRSGDQAPESAALERLAAGTGVTAEWYTRPVAASTSTPLFRSNASAHVAARNMLSARVELTQDVAIAFSEFVDFAPVNIPNHSIEDLDQLSSAEIESAACECRDAWRLGRGAIQDLALAAESAGVIVVREQTGVPGIEGLSAWSRVLQRPLILLSADKANAYRSRFDLAHELGHIVLHRKIVRSVDNVRFNEIERQAHAFAGALLLPAETFAQEVRTPVALDDLLLLKRRWGVSVAAIIKRLHALKIIDGDGEQALFKRRSARWGAKSEPGDDDRAPEVPRMFARTVQLLVTEGVMPLETIPRHLGLSSLDVAMIVGLPEEYFATAPTEPTEPTLTRLRTEKREPSDNVLPFRPKG
jgi:Zn-dependent peptidase ImmA (M78 family)